MASFEFLAIIVSLLGLSASITYYAIVLRNQNITRQAQLYMQLFQKDTSTEFQKIVYNLTKLDTSNPKELEEQFRNDQQLAAELRSFMFHLDGIGNMIRNGLITIDRASQIGAGVGPIEFWVHLRPWIIHYRETRNIPDYMSGFEFYAGEIAKIRKKKGYSTNWIHKEQTFTS